MSARIIVTKPGYNANEDPDPRNVNFDSDLASLKYYVEGTEVVSGGAGYTETTIAHNLGYKPFFAAYIGPLVEAADFSMVPFVFADFSNFFLGSAWVDDTNLYLQIWHDYGTTVNATFYYKIFRNNLGL